MTTAPSRLTPNVRGVWWMLLAVFTLTSMFTLAKHLTATLPVEQVSLFRMVMSLAFYIPWLLHYGLEPLRTKRPMAHFWRAAFGASSVVCGIYAVQNLRLADATVLLFTIPLWSILLAMLVLGERVRARRTVATIIGFAGVVVIVKPQVGVEPAAVVALLGAVLASCAVTTMKNLTRTEPTERIVFYFLFYGTLLLALPAWFVWQMPSATEWAWLGLLGLFGSTGQYFLTRAYAVGEMTLVAPLDFLRVIIAGVFGFVLFAEIPDGWAFAGAAIVVGACVYIVRREAMLRKRAG